MVDSQRAFAKGMSKRAGLRFECENPLSGVGDDLDHGNARMVVPVMPNSS